MTPFKNLFGGLFRRSTYRSPLQADAAVTAPNRGFVKSRSTNPLLSSLRSSTVRAGVRGRSAAALRGAIGTPTSDNSRYVAVDNANAPQLGKISPLVNRDAACVPLVGLSELESIGLWDAPSTHDPDNAGETIFFEGNYRTLAEIQFHLDLEEACQKNASDSAEKPAPAARPAKSTFEPEKLTPPPAQSAKHFPASFPLPESATRKTRPALTAPVLPPAPSDLFRYVAPTGNVVTNYCSANVDMARLDSALRKSHVALSVSGARNNCWMRTTWLSALIQGTPEHIEKQLTDKLGAGNQADIQTIVQAATELKQKGLRSVFGRAGAFTQKTEDAMANISFALLERNLEAENHKTIIESIERVEKGLPSLAVPSEAEVATKLQAMWNSTIGTADGDTELSAVIMRDLGLDLLIVSNHGDAGHQGKSIEISASHDSPLNRMPMTAVSGLQGSAQRAAMGANTAALHGAVAPLPFLIQNGGYGGGHFTFYAPKDST
jgi:hypothetical protein